MLASGISAPQWLEAAMLICFGLSWPISVWKTYRTKQIGGKSLRFMLLILLGYFAGIAAKITRALALPAPLEPVTTLYIFNAVFVTIDITLHLRYRLGSRSNNSGSPAPA